MSVVDGGSFGNGGLRWCPPLTMDPVGRWRPVRRAVALLVAVLLVALTICCGSLGGDSHLDQANGAAWGSVSSVVDGHAHRVLDDLAADCGGHPHHAHCIIQSVLPGAATITVLLQLLSMLAAVVAVIAPSAVGGVRGPPVGSALVVEGREVLTRFCISRR